MTIYYFIIIVLSVSLNAIAQIFLKSAATSHAVQLSATSYEKLIKALGVPALYGGISMYILSIGIWFLALAKVPVSVAYPMLSIGYVINLVLAYYFFNELITVSKVFGIFLIVFGVFILARS